VIKCVGKIDMLVRIVVVC